MTSRHSCHLTENQNFGDCKHFETTGQMNCHEIYCLQHISAQPSAHTEACNKLLPCTGTLLQCLHTCCVRRLTWLGEEYWQAACFSARCCSSAATTLGPCRLPWEEVCSASLCILPEPTHGPFKLRWRPTKQTFQYA